MSSERNKATSSRCGTKTHEIANMGGATQFRPQKIEKNAVQIRKMAKNCLNEKCVLKMIIYVPQRQ